MNKEELLKYELPSISEYCDFEWMQTLVGRYSAWKVNKKIRRYNKRKEREEFIRKILNK